MKDVSERLAYVLNRELMVAETIGKDRKIVVRNIAISAADVFATASWAFDRERFYFDCGLGPDGELPPNS